PDVHGLGGFRVAHPDQVATTRHSFNSDVIMKWRCRASGRILTTMTNIETPSREECFEHIIVWLRPFIIPGEVYELRILDCSESYPEEACLSIPTHTISSESFQHTGFSAASCAWSSARAWAPSWGPCWASLSSPQSWAE